jgi:hypothetical protein
MAALGSRAAIVKYVIKFARTKARLDHRGKVAGIDPQRIAVSRHQIRYVVSACLPALCGSKTMQATIKVARMKLPRAD